MHAGQVVVAHSTARALVDEQFPQWRDLPLHRVRSSGTVHTIFRLGDGLAARFRLEADEVDARFPTPEPVAIGEPGSGYPMPWLVQTWLEGTVAMDADPGESELFAMDLAEFITGVRGIDTRGGRFGGRGRGGVLGEHDEWMQECLERSEGLLDVGGLAPADPALDLVSAWHLLEAGPRQVMRDQLGTGDEEWERGKGWAFQQAMGAVWYYAESNPTFSQMARRTLERITAQWIS